MYRSLLGALMIGLFPATDVTFVPASVPTVSVEKIAVAPPSEELGIEARFSGSGIYVMDLSSGQMLYGRQATMQRPMASLTKLMTAIIIVENHELDEVVEVPEDISDIVGNVAYLPSGSTFTVGDMLSALLITSGNDAARTLALFHSGSLEAFVEEMNRRAHVLGLRATSFQNPDGLDHPAHWSTPRDLAWLAVSAMRHPEIAERMGRRGERIVSTNGATTLHLTHTHAFLHADTSVVAGKTGTTSAAGECLLSVVRAGNRSYLVVILNSLQRYMDMRTVLNALEGVPSSTTAMQAR